MNQSELTNLIDKLLNNWENEVVEFKQASKNYSTSDVGKYFTALANEANLRGAENGWLVFGVDDKTRKIVGTGGPGPSTKHKTSKSPGDQPGHHFSQYSRVKLPACTLNHI